MRTAEKLYNYRRKQRELAGKKHPDWKDLSKETREEWQKFAAFIGHLYKRNARKEIKND